MKILVCIKQVINPEGDIKINSSRNWIEVDRSTLFNYNRFDEYAVQEAVLIKKNIPGTTIDIISVGPKRVSAAIKRLQALGADHGIHVLTPEDQYDSPDIIAEAIASVARDNTYDLILAGVMSEDYMQGLVGPYIAAILNRPCATSVIFEKISHDHTSIYVEREIEGGYKDKLEMKLPAVLTVQTGINKPLYPTLRNMLKAKKEKMEQIEIDRLISVDPRQTITELSPPPKLRSGKVLQGDQKEKAIQLISILNEKNIISI